MKINLQDLLKTKIQVECFDEQHNSLFVKNFTNTITYKGIDRIPYAFVQGTMLQVTHLYALFTNNSTPGLTAGTEQSVTRSTFYEDVGDNRGAFWVPVTGVPSITSSASMYESNTVQWQFLIDNAVVSSIEAGSFSLDNSKIKALGLAIATDYSDRTKDIIFSVINIPDLDAFVIPDGATVEVKYQLIFNA